MSRGSAGLYDFSEIFLQNTNDMKDNRKPLIDSPAGEGSINKKVFYAYNLLWQKHHHVI